MWHRLGGVLLASIVLVTPAQAQSTPTGSVSVFGDYFPNRSDTTELRTRLFVEEKLAPLPSVALTFSGFAEGLLARRPAPGGGLETATDGLLSVVDAKVDVSGRRVELLAGYARVNWGKLDEIQPTDVINPLDVSRFFFEGRSEARLPVLLARARLHVSENVTVEGVYVPDFRPGRFDRLDEASSPFNLTTGVALPPTVIDREPRLTWSNGQGGARVSATTGRVDWSVSAYRGFETFPLFALVPVSTSGPLSPPSGPRPPASVDRIYPRFTMIGADFEAVRGAWGLRGEVAGFVDDHFQSPEARIVPGRSFDAGAGVDRRAGDYTVSATVLVHGESYDERLSASDDSTGRSDVSMILSSERTFARERYRLRAFGVYNATEASGFVRVIGMASLRDNLSLEASVGWFAGDGRDLVGRFGDSDFLYLRLKYFF